MGVEPTTRLAKSRITGFEDREDHRTLFASGKSIVAASRNCIVTPQSYGDYGRLETNTED